MPSSARAFVLRHTRLRPVPAVGRIRLHLADEVLPLWRATQLETRDEDAPLPYWAFAWAGGLALASYLRDHPEAVAGRSVFDFGSGSGVVAIAAALAGAIDVTASDVDPFAVAAIALNARANGVGIEAIRRDVLDGPPPDADVVLAADCWYEAGFAGRVLPWLERASDAGADVLVGDPGRRYLPLDALEPLASYYVRTTTELEDLDQKRATVYRLRSDGAESSSPSDRARAIA
ncbi:MAG TPA: 50S ribosomal protein L11 methyltransferase [Candidatus Limnocylindrales bacterium]|nr:50S ribosomal protein L11 methyltransferase [Candidatus Limnocylindrales bacterium]